MSLSDDTTYFETGMLKSCAKGAGSVAKSSTLRHRAKIWVRRLVSVAEVGR